jgi:hypothetical protein
MTFRRELAVCGTLARLVGNYIQVMLMQMNQAAACNARHPVPGYGVHRQLVVFPARFCTAIPRRHQCTRRSNRSEAGGSTGWRTSRRDCQRPDILPARLPAIVTGPMPLPSRRMSDPRLTTAANSMVSGFGIRAAADRSRSAVHDRGVWTGPERRSGIERRATVVTLTCPRCGHQDRMSGRSYAQGTDGIICGLCEPPAARMLARLTA